MKKKYIGMALGIVMAAGMAVTGCGSSSVSAAGKTSSGVISEAIPSTSASASTAAAAAGVSDTSDETTVYGEISAISGETVTIKVGTISADAAGAAGSAAESTAADASAASPGSSGSAPQQPTLTLTGDTKDLTVTDSTVITKGFDAGSAPSGDNAGAAPSGQAPSGDNAGAAPSGQAPSGQAPQAETLSLSDLTVGEDITVTLDASGNVTSIVTGIDMMRGQGQPGGGMGGQPGSAPGAAPSDSSAAASSATSAE